jgi:hypothetical protein
MWLYYTYELIDPRDNKVFYVGKGKGNRMLAHEKEAKKGVVSPKCNKIREILKARKEVLKRQVAFFNEEQAAYDHETDMISAYGLKNLTNIMPGGQKAWDTRVESRSKQSERKEYQSNLDMWLKIVAYSVHIARGWRPNTNGRPWTDAIVNALKRAGYDAFLDKALKDFKKDDVVSGLLKRGVKLTFV